MQVYRRPKGQWNRLSRKYRSNLFQTYLGSPIIELDGHQYMEVEYFAMLEGAGRFPDVNIRGTIVLCDGTAEVRDAATARKVMRLALQLPASADVASIGQDEYFAAYDERDSQASPGFVDQIAWYKENFAVLCKYVPHRELTSMVQVCKDHWEIVRKLGEEAKRELQVLSDLLQRRMVQAEQIEAMNQLSLSISQWYTRHLQAVLDRGKLAGQLSQQLSSRRQEWERDEAVASICDQVLQRWEMMHKAVEMTQKKLEETIDAESRYAERHAIGWKERIDERIALYRVPLVREDGSATRAEPSSLTEAELDRLVSSLPPLPEYPPWRTRPAKLRVNHAWVIAMMVVSIAGIGLSIARMVLAGISFSAITQALFFASWLFIFPRFWKRR
jgi:hypothetical protein